MRGAKQVWELRKGGMSYDDIALEVDLDRQECKALYESYAKRMYKLGVAKRPKTNKGLASYLRATIYHQRNDGVEWSDISLMVGLKIKECKNLYEREQTRVKKAGAKNAEKRLENANFGDLRKIRRQTLKGRRPAYVMKVIAIRKKLFPENYHGFEAEW